MKRLFQVTRHLDAPADAVWDVMVDVTRWPEWTPTVSNVRRLDGGEFGVGSRVEIHQPKLPKAQWQVTELDVTEDRRGFTWEAEGPGMRTVARHDVTTRGDGSTVTLSIEQLGPMGAVAALLWRGLTQRYIETEAAGLEQRVQQTRTR